MIILYAEDDPEDLDTFCDIVNLINPEIKCIHAKDGSEVLEILDNAIVLPDYIFGHQHAAHGRQDLPAQH